MSSQILTSSQSRQAALVDEFLASLDDWGLLHARTRLRAAVLRFAGFTELPPEILCQIGPLLGLRDVLNCRLVSRDWYQAWTHQTVLLTLCRAYFPGLRETHPNSKPDELFLQAAANHLKWDRHGYKREVIPWKLGWSTDGFTNKAGPPDAARSRDLGSVMMGFKVQYNDGMIAWQTDHSLAIVDDLRNRTRQRCALRIGAGPGRRLEVEAVSRDLVVFMGTTHTQRYEKAVYVRYLKEKKWDTVLLPAKCARCYLDGQRLGIVTELGHVILWAVGKGALQLDVDEIRSSFDNIGARYAFAVVPGLILSPARPDSVYVVWGRWHDNDSAKIFTVLVVKFEDRKMAWRKEFSIDRPIPAPGGDCDQGLSFHVQMQCKQADAYGSYSLVIFALENDEDIECSCEGWPQDNSQWGSISFNVISETFSELVHKGPSKMRWTHGSWLDFGSIDGTQPTPLLQGMCLWNQNLLLSWHTGEEATAEGGHRIILETSSIVSQQTLPNMRIDDYTMVDDDTETSFAGQLFMDDNFIVMPTRSALVVWESKTTRSRNLSQNTDDSVGESINKATDVERPEWIVRVEDQTILNPSRRSWVDMDWQDVEHTYDRYQATYGAGI